MMEAMIIQKNNNEVYFKIRKKLINTSIIKKMLVKDIYAKRILKSKKKWILLCDLDMSVKPNQVDIWMKKFLNKNNQAYFASRKHAASKIRSSIIRRLLGFFFNIIIYLLFNIKIKDTQCGFKLLNKATQSRFSKNKFIQICF